MPSTVPLESFLTVKRIAVGGFGASNSGPQIQHDRIAQLRTGVVDEGVGPNDEPVAIKKELASDKVTRPILEHEFHVYKALAGHECILDVKAYGRQSSHIVMIMDLLGPSLGDQFRNCANHFSLLTTTRLALGMLNALEHIHSHGFVHRDIKPENFLLGRGDKSHIVYPVDFGLVRPWRHLTPGARVSSSSLDEESGVIGTLPFASINAHLGLEQTRRDDLQALAYSILLFARGNLPWENIRGPTRVHCARRILEKKRRWTPNRLCQGLPSELEEFTKYCFDLDVNEDPDYDLLRTKLKFIAIREGLGANSKYEWEEPGWTASRPEEAVLEPVQLPQPRIKQGDIILLRVDLPKSLDYEPLPRVPDPSFFPHQVPEKLKWNPYYRPALIRKVVVHESDPTYFKLEVFPLCQKNGLEGLSKRRTGSFQRLETCLTKETGVQIDLKDLYVYRTALLSTYKVEYDKVSSFTATLSLPENALEKFESGLSNVPTPYSLVYDSDDGETRSIRRRLPKIWCSQTYIMDVRSCELDDLTSSTSDMDLGGVNGWIEEMMIVEQVRRVEDGGKENDDSDSDSDSDAGFWDCPRPVDRRLSCTINTSRTAAPAA